MAKAKDEAVKEEKPQKSKLSEDKAKLANEAEDVQPTATAKKAVAKAGKRSTKAIKDAEDKQAKEDRKASLKEEPDVKKAKATAKLPRNRLDKRGKKYKKSYELIDKNKLYNAAQAAELAVKTTTTKFDATVELHVRLGVDPKQADQNVRASVVLPAGSGRDIKVAVFADARQVEAAKKAGADIAKDDEFLQQLEKNELNFDVLISTPANMPKLGKFAKVLGPKGLMPNPKSGTVTDDVAKAVSEAKAGKVEYRVDANGIVHVPIGKVGFGVEKLTSNLEAIITSINANKPASLKSNYILSVYITTSMGPSIKLDASSV